MKKKTLTRIFGVALSAIMAVTSIQMPTLADGAEGTEITMEEITVDGGGDEWESVSENGVEDDYEDGEPDEDNDQEAADELITADQIDIFEADVANMSDEEVSKMILSASEGDVKVWLATLTEEEKDTLLARDTALTQAYDVYENFESDDFKETHYDTFLSYLDTIDESKVSMTYSATSGTNNVVWGDGQTSIMRIKFSGVKAGETTTGTKITFTATVSNAKNGFGFNKDSYVMHKKEKDGNYYMVYCGLHFTRPAGYKSSVSNVKSHNDQYNHYTKVTTDGNVITGYSGDYSGVKTGGAAAREEFFLLSNIRYWNCINTGNTKYNAYTSISLTPITYTASYNSNGGSAVAPVTCTYPNKSATPAITRGAGYIVNFSGNGGSSTSIANSYTFGGWSDYAVPNTQGAVATRTASWVDNGVNASSATSSRTGYQFAGWFTAASGGSQVAGIYKPGKNVTLYAHWNNNKYTVVYDGNGGSKPANTTAAYDTAFNLPSSTRAGYDFLGWSGAGLSQKTGQVKNLTDQNNGTVSLTAVWKAKQYTITYNPNGGQVTPTSNGVTFDQPCPTAPTPTRTGYTFTGWSGGTYAGTYKTASDTTVKAGWKANEYTVSFNPDGGTEVAEIKATYDKDVILPEAPTKTDFLFAGWSDGVNTYKAGDTVKNLTAEAGGKVSFKALWVASTFTIHFDANGGAQVKDIKYHFGDNTTLPSPSRADDQDGDTIIKYTFAGWKDDKGKIYTTAQDVKAESPLVNGVLNLKAMWDESVSKITDGGGTVIEQPKYETNNYTNNYNMTDEQAKMFLEKLSKGIASEITIKGIRFVTIKNTDGTITIRLEDLGGFKDISIPDSIQIGDAVIPVTIIDQRAFKENTTLERVILGKNVTTIKESAFENCKNLKEITFNNGLVTIEKRAFYGCSALKQITTSKDLKSIGESAFENCTSLSKVTLNNGLLDIGAKAFRNCKSLKTITIPKTVLKIGNQAFENCTKLTSIKFAAGSDLQLIGKSAFAGCKVLKSVKLPDRLTVLSDKAFYNCVKLKKVTGGKGLVTIGNKAFMNCKSLTKITLYTNVSKVGKQAFYGCKKLKKVTIKSKVLTKVGSKAFKKCHKKIVFYVPDKAKKAAYKKLLKGKF